MIRSFSLLVFGLALGGCSDDSGSGTVRVWLSGEEAAVEGFPVGSGEDEIAFADGFSLSFEKVILSVEDVRLRTTGGNDANVSADPIVVDLHQGDTQGWIFDGVPAGRWSEVSYVYGPPTTESRNVNGVDPADVERMVANGYALFIEGSATDGEETYRFELGFDLRVENVACENGIDGTDGIVVPRGGVVDAELTIHLDHLFFDSYAHDDPDLRFEAFAAVADEERLITMEALATQSLADLRNRQGEPLADGGSLIVYDPGPLTLSANDLRAYLRAAVTTTGHFNGEGHCDYIEL